MFGIEKQIRSAVFHAPKDILDGLVTVLGKPPQKVYKIWESLSDEDQKLFRKATLSALRLTAKAIIAADKGQTVKF